MKQYSEAERRIWTAGVFLISVVAAVMILAAFALPGSGCNPLAAAWKTTAGAMEITKGTAPQIIDTIARPKHEACLKTHGAKSAGYGVCIASTHKRLKAWPRYGRPGMRSGVATTYAGLRVSEAAGKKDFDVLEALTPGLCGGIRVAKEWEAEYPDKAKGLIKVFQLVGSFVCKPQSISPKSVVGILGIAADVVKWLVKIIGSPVDELKKTIDDWLRKPTPDAVDALLGEIEAALPAQ